MAGPYPVNGDQYCNIDRKMTELKRQLMAKSGSPIDPYWLDEALQALIEQRPFTKEEAKIAANIRDEVLTTAYFENRLPGVSWSYSARFILMDNMIHKVGDLAYLSEKELKALPGVGKVTISFAHSVCKAAGFQLGEAADTVERNAFGTPVPIVLNQAQSDSELRDQHLRLALTIVDLGGDVTKIYGLTRSEYISRIFKIPSTSYQKDAMRDGLNSLIEFFSSFGLTWPKEST